MEENDNTSPQDHQRYTRILSTDSQNHCTSLDGPFCIPMNGLSWDESAPRMFGGGLRRRTHSSIDGRPLAPDEMEYEGDDILDDTDMVIDELSERLQKLMQSFEEKLDKLNDDLGANKDIVKNKKGELAKLKEEKAGLSKKKKSVVQKQVSLFSEKTSSSDDSHPGKSEEQNELATRDPKLNPRHIKRNLRDVPVSHLGVLKPVRSPNPSGDEFNVERYRLHHQKQQEQNEFSVWATQSSVFHGRGAHHAIDGLLDGWWPNLAHTGKEHQAWLQVDMGRHVPISRVRLWNRRDADASVRRRLFPFWILVSDQPFSEVSCCSGACPCGKKGNGEPCGAVTCNSLEDAKAIASYAVEFTDFSQCSVDVSKRPSPAEYCEYILPHEDASSKMRYVRVQHALRKDGESRHLHIGELEVFARVGRQIQPNVNEKKQQAKNEHEGLKSSSTVQHLSKAIENALQKAGIDMVEDFDDKQVGGDKEKVQVLMMTVDANGNAQFNAGDNTAASFGLDGLDTANLDIKFSDIGTMFNEIDPEQLHKIQESFRSMLSQDDVQAALENLGDIKTAASQAAIQSNDNGMAHAKGAKSEHPPKTITPSKNKYSPPNTESPKSPGSKNIEPTNMKQKRKKKRPPYRASERAL